MRTSLGLALATIALSFTVPAAAQNDMGQGEARITSRSDVRLSMESMPGTGGGAMAHLGHGVGAQMARLRHCYEERVEQDPTVTGTLRLRFLLDERGRPHIEVDQDGVNDAAVLRCMTRILERLDTGELTRPTHAVVVFELANTAARGVEESAERAREVQAVALTTDADGNPAASGGSGNGRVHFTLTGHGSDSAPAVSAAYRALMTTVPGLLDCRRHSGRHGRSPGGDLTGAVQIHGGRRPAARITRSTVPNERTQRCVNRVLRHIEQRPPSGNGRVSLQIHFEPADDVEADD